jgi:hypothetical protein
MTEGNLISTLMKGAQKIIFITAADDDFLINVLTVNKKEQVTRQSMIIRTDLQQWLNLYKSAGYVQTR